MLVFIGHEKNIATGASVYLNFLYMKCTRNKQFYTFKVRKLKLFWMLAYVIKLIMIQIRNNDVVFHLNSASNLYLAFVSKFLGFNFVLHIHETPEFLGTSYWKKSLIRHIEQHIIFVDERLKKIYPKGHCIRNVVNVERMEYLRPRVSPKLIFAVIGSIDSNKNQLSAIEFLNAQTLSKKIQLKLIGPHNDKAYMNVIKERIMHVKYEVILTGARNRNLIHSEYDILIACSKYESFGLAVAEALSLNKPVIFLNADAYPEKFLFFKNICVQPKSLDDKLIKELVTLSQNSRDRDQFTEYSLQGLNNYYEEYFNITNCFQ